MKNIINKVKRYLVSGKVESKNPTDMAKTLFDTMDQYDKFNVTFRRSRTVSDSVLTVATNDQTTITIHGQEGEDIYNVLIRMILNAR